MRSTHADRLRENADRIMKVHVVRESVAKESRVRRKQNFVSTSTKVSARKHLV